MKKYLLMLAAVIGLSGCGTPVEVPTSYVGKIQTTKGFQGGVISPSKFRLDKCWSYCDKLVLLEASDQVFNREFKTFMPKDKLNLTYGVSMTLAIDPKEYDQIFSIIPAQSQADQLAVIRLSDVFDRTASTKINTLMPQILTKFTIAEIASNRDRVNEFVQSELAKQLKGTPFIVKVAGLTNVDYPKIITDAQENAAKRKENEDQVLAQRNLDLLQIQTDKEVETQRRELEMMKAATTAMVADKMFSQNYLKLRQLEVLEKLASSENKVFVPTEMLDSIAVQNMVAK
jgi:hypothetical protein